MELKAALIGVLAGALTQLVIVSVLVGGWRERLRQHSDLFKMLPCLKPTICLKGESIHGN